jgi:serine/threonine-protein kinase HipA
VRLAPVYGMLTATVYEDFAKNPPGLPVGGRSSWSPGKALELFLQTRCGIKPREALQRIERICEAMVKVSPQVVRAAKDYEFFNVVGPQMLHAWNNGMNSLRLQKTWSLPTLNAQIATTMKRRANRKRTHAISDVSP